MEVLRLRMRDSLPEAVWHITEMSFLLGSVGLRKQLNKEHGSY